MQAVGDEERVLDSTVYGVKLEVFEGPLDLLLYLIHKDELDIYDIPVARITAQYLAFLDQLHGLDLEQASGFILMAATLMRIKVQMLLPREEIPGEEESFDPRADLVRHLLEYQQFKEVAEWLDDQRLGRHNIFLRQSGLNEGEIGADLHPVSFFDLLKAYQHVISNVPREAVHRIVEARVSVETCILQVLELLERQERLRFYDLVRGQGKITLLSTFMALLELLRQQRIHVQQAQPFEEIWIERRQTGVALPEDPAGVEPEPSALAREQSGSATEADESAMETTEIEPEPKVRGEEIL
ncbi:MAG: segregation/condensation protein A [Candidatus Latescibacteria bacterium]|nr:segregation/condensation protein A [Candidatus Latescibacterota bacterium]